MSASKVAMALACAGMVPALALAGCGRPASPPSAGQPQAQAADPGYHGPPVPLGVTRATDGGVFLSGRAFPSASVRMVSPAGARIETTADGSGAWKVAMGPVSEPTLYRLAEEVVDQKGAGRRIEAEGYVAVTPVSAAVLRAGSGALSLEAAQPGLRIQAVDFDSGGATVVSGRTSAGQPLRVSVDGMLALDGAASADGRFSLTLPKPVMPGSHRIQIATPKGATEAVVTLGPSAPLTDGPYRAAQEGAGWRIDWMTPGGGPQTTLLLGG